MIRSTRLKKLKVASRSNQSGARFQCRIDRRKFSRCKSPKVYRRIKLGRHAITVRAIKNGKTGPVKIVKFRIIRRR